jgi:hypothetical protein
MSAIMESRGTQRLAEVTLVGTDQAHVYSRTLLPTLEELLAALCQEFRASGMTEDELYELLDEAHDEVSRERRKRNSA